MDLREFFRTLVRNRYLAVVAVVLSVAATFLVVRALGPDYQSEGTVVLLPPVSRSTQGGSTVVEGNPYLSLGNLNQARDLVIRRMTSQVVADKVAKSEPDVSYDLTADAQSTGPVILIRVSASSAAASTSALRSVMAQVPSSLNALQASLKPADYITSQPLTADVRPKAVHKGQIRAGIVAGGGTLLAGLLLIALIDSLRGSPKPRRRPETDLPGPGQG